MSSLPLSPRTWSELPAEIIGLIVSNLGKNDLLGSRLVCCAWNEESLRVLRKSRFSQQLSESSINEYLEFARSSNSSHVLPFHLNFTVDLKNPKFKGTVPLKTLTRDVESLCRIFGEDCVSELSLSTDDFVCSIDNFKDLGLIELFSLISPGLKTLDLSGFKVDMEKVTSMDFMGHRNLTFPKLRKMKCYSLGNSLRGPATASPIYIYVTENSPHLEDLELTDACDLKSWPLRFDILKRLVLETIVDPSDILDKIHLCNSVPVLRELHFKNLTRDVNNGRIGIHNILESVSATLKTLKICIPHHAALPLVTFPPLPYLEHLEIVSDMYDLIFINHEKINFNAETLPSLKSINLPIGIVFTHTSWSRDWDGEEEVRMEFPNVDRITLNVNSDKFKKTLKHFQKIFPKPSRVSIVKGKRYSGIAWDEHVVKQMLDQIIQSPWSKGIEEIDLKGFDQDYLGQVLDRLDFPPRIILQNCEGESILEKKIKEAFVNVMGAMKEEHTVEFNIESGQNHGSLTLQQANDYISHQMTNITKVSLEFMNRPGSKYGIEEATSYLLSPVAMPNLTAMARHFPHLRTIEISEDLFPQHDKDIRREHIQKFKSRFPNVMVNVI